jgi:hypothetical protein
VTRAQAAFIFTECSGRDPGSGTPASRHHRRTVTGLTPTTGHAKGPPTRQYVDRFVEAVPLILTFSNPAVQEQFGRLHRLLLLPERQKYYPHVQTVRPSVGPSSELDSWPRVAG